MERQTISLRKLKLKRIIKPMSDTIFILAISFFLFIITMGTIARIKSGIFTVFGNTYLNIASGSMENSNIYAGDVISVRKGSFNNLKIGDNIAFFHNGSQTPDNILFLENYVSNTVNNSALSLSELFSIGNDYYTFAHKNNCEIWFHQIVEIKVDENGELWFKTWGTSNIDINNIPQYDSNWTNENYIIGKYNNKLSVVSWIMKTATTFFTTQQFFFAVFSILFLINAFLIISVIDKKIWISKLISGKANITNEKFNQKFFKDINLQTRIKILETANPNQLIEYKNKLYSCKHYY